MRHCDVRSMIRKRRKVRIGWEGRRMAHDGMPELHVTGFNVQAGARRAGLGSDFSVAVPLVALEIEGRSTPAAADEPMCLRLPVAVARALAVELVEQADRAERLMRRLDPRQASCA
jgi:hypothetical protein